MNNILLATVFLFSLSTLAELISDEMVPVILKNNAFACFEKYEGDGGFSQPMPAKITLSSHSIIDRTLRIKGHYFDYILPDLVTCESLSNQIKAIPLSLLVNRKIKRTLIASNINSALIEEISIELPVQINGKNIILQNRQFWLEENPYNPNISYPKQSSYIAHTHPQSATAPVGLFCAPLHKESTKYTLSFGRFTNSSPYQVANIDVISTSPFDNEALCLESKSMLTKSFQAEDPENWGSKIKVNRTIELVNRYILDNQAKIMCQEIMLESVSIDINGINFSAVGASFPLRTIDLELCGHNN